MPEPIFTGALLENGQTKSRIAKPLSFLLQGLVVGALMIFPLLQNITPPLPRLAYLVPTMSAAPPAVASAASAAVSRIASVS